MPPKRKNTRATKAGSKKRKVVEEPTNANEETGAGASPDKVPEGNGEVAGGAEATVETSTQPADSTVAVAAEKPADSSPRFVGKFDLYSTMLPFLTKPYLPPGATEPQFEAVYKEILTKQAKSDFSARIALREDTPDANVAKNGMFSCGMVYNPMSEEEITPIRIVHGAAKSVSFSTAETLHKSMVGEASGYIARLELDTDECDQCGIKSGAGSLKMRRVWEGKSATGEKQELFEGSFFFKTQHGPLLSRKGWGSSMPYSSGFWAVRALKGGDGEEIGIDAGDGRPKRMEMRHEDWDEEDEDEYQ
ncbi:hypothetical protein EIP86_010200 [Pleurotus ostreatoroseus]|nr:hypothetical protein EIP86_010200 [Pleurotus ostreatoroseus]